MDKKQLITLPQTFAEAGPSGDGGGKSGKGGGSGGSYTEDPNTVQSDSVMTAVDVLGEGPIIGPWLGVRSVYLNNVPLLNIATGAPNFTGIVTDFRPGTPDQTPFVGMNTIEVPTLVGVQVTNGTGQGFSAPDQPQTSAVGNPPRAPYNFEIGEAAGPTVVNPDAIGIIMQLPSLTYLDQNANELKGNSVSYSFWCQGSDMTDFAQIGGDTLNAKFTYAYQKSYVVIPVGAPPWVIQVRRDTEDFTQDNYTGDTYVYSYSAIYDQQLQYLNTAAMAILIDALQFAQSTRLVRGMRDSNGCRFYR